MSSILMDIYTLSRMMYQQGNEVICYAGYNHIYRYMEFFELFLDVDPVFKIEIQDLNDNVEHRHQVNRCISSDLLLQYIPIDQYVAYNTM